MKYYIADVHFGHKNILKFENRLMTKDEILNFYERRKTE